MPQFHRLDPKADAPFLRRGVADPLTGVAFRPTNAVVQCATCGLVSLRETWEAVGGCPNGHTTAAPWRGGGDGAAGAAPRPPRAPAAAPPPRRRGWLVPLLLVLGVAAVAIAGLVVAGQMRGDDEPVEVIEAAPTAPTGPTPVAVQAGEIEGTLSASDFSGPDGRSQDLYTFAADSSGRVLTFSVSSDAFLPDLVVETPDGRRAEAETLPALTSEDGADETRRVIVRDLRGAGLYRIFVSSRRPGVEGDYTLTIRREDPVRPLTAGTAFEAELGAFSQRVDGFFRDTYRFRGEAGRAHTLTVRSGAFAPTVAVTTPGNAAVSGESGRAGGSVTFTFTPTASGTYSATVSSRERDKKGKYSVVLAVAAPEPTAPRVEASGLRANEAPLRDSLAVGQQRAYTVRGRIGDRVLVEVRTSGFTPTLTLVGPDGSRVPAEPDGDRARVRLTLPSEGVYRVLVGAQGEGAGPFTVVLEQRQAVTADEIPRLPGQLQRPPPPANDGGGNQPYRPQPIGDGGVPAPGPRP